jgi:hypothetical protein
MQTGSRLAQYSFEKNYTSEKKIDSSKDLSGSCGMNGETSIPKNTYCPLRRKRGIAGPIERWDRPVPSDHCWSRYRLISLIPEVVDDEDMFFTDLIRSEALAAVECNKV